MHGTGKSTHIEQVAARLNWPCVRVNLDGHISRLDLVGRDGIVIRDGKQVTEFQEGIVPWALQRPVALIFDEYDAPHLQAEPERADWSFGEEEGYIDGRRLSQLISSPGECRLFRLERLQLEPHCLVSLLRDSSGSMKGHIELVAVLIDVFGRALQQAGVTTEILGFTTGAWNGGRVHRCKAQAGLVSPGGRRRGRGLGLRALYRAERDPASVAGRLGWLSHGHRHQPGER